MRNLFFLVALIAFFSCEKEGALTKSISNGIDASAVLQYSGVFQPTSGISVQGNANVFFQHSIQKLQLENISITDGPDLKVYLSKSSVPNEYVNLGNFQGNGTSVYTIPTGINLSAYPYVLIHCQQYNHLFAIAPLYIK